MIKNFLLYLILIFFLLLGSSLAILSTIGFQTDKFNRIITDKIDQENKEISIKLEKIKFKFDFRNLSLFLETSNPELIYQNLNIPLENIKAYLDFESLIKSKSKIKKINISSKEIDIAQLKKIIVKTKPSNLNSLIINKVEKGKLFTSIELFLDEKFNINNFIAKGKVSKMKANFSNDLILDKVNFNFFIDTSDILINNAEGAIDGILIKEANLQINKDNYISVKSEFFTEIDLKKKNILDYLKYLKNTEFFNQEDVQLKANLNHNLNIIFDDTFKVKKYHYNNKGSIKKLNISFKDSFKNNFQKDPIKNLALKDSNFTFVYNSDKKKQVNLNGNYQINNDDFQSYFFQSNFFKDINIKLDFDFTKKISFDIINYEKNENEIAKVSSNFNIKKDLIIFDRIRYEENKNLIIINDLKIKKKDLISLKNITVKTFKKDILNNDFNISFGKKIKIKGNKYDATKLNKIFNQQSKNNFIKKITKEIDIELINIKTPLSKKLNNFKLIGAIKKGEFIKILSKGDFGDNKYLDISLRSSKGNKKKYLEIYSDLPQPLLSEFTFFKGLLDGTLIYSSIIEGDASNSNLIIENFKIVNAPSVVKLLSLADFGGLADLAAGEGLSFEKLEIKMSNNKNFLKLEELYAVGPSISVLMEGYKEQNGLTSLRGTLVPAKNLNKILSKIPVIGKIIIPKEIGEGLFGVSFKMKGKPGKMKTTINPIKTITPRFITKALERSKKSK
tara:strand:- start:724 stop:2919 length:2196 start_codon:yes stop_codon:yes gene_type:complete